MTKSKNRFYHLWYVFIFLFLYLWFTQIHPLSVYDADDCGTYLKFAEHFLSRRTGTPPECFRKYLCPFCPALLCIV